MQGSKRPRSGTSESFGQAGMVLNPSMTEYGTLEANMSMNGATSEQIASRWGWDDDDRGMGMDIQALLSEFGDFGDFFENDALPFGEVIYIFYARCWIIYPKLPIWVEGMLIFRARQLARPCILITLGFSSLFLNRIVPDSLVLVSKAFLEREGNVRLQLLHVKSHYSFSLCRFFRRGICNKFKFILSAASPL